MLGDRDTEDPPPLDVGLVFDECLTEAAIVIPQEPGECMLLVDRVSGGGVAG